MILDKNVKKKLQQKILKSKRNNPIIQDVTLDNGNNDCSIRGILGSFYMIILYLGMIFALVITLYVPYRITPFILMICTGNHLHLQCNNVTENTTKFTNDK